MDSFGQGGFLREILGSDNPLHQYLGGLPDPYPTQKGDGFGGFGGFGNLGSNQFLSSLIPSGLDLVSALLPSTSVMPRAVAQARGQATVAPTASQPTTNGTQGPIARALAQAQAATSGAATGDAINRVAQYAPLFAQIGAEMGVPGDYLQALAATENSGETATSPAGARGLMQVVPGQGYDQPGENWQDPATSIRQGARALKAKYQATGDWDRAVAAYFGYGTDAGGQTTSGYTQSFQQNLQRVRQGSAQPQQSQAAPTLPAPPAGTRPLQGITTLQYGSEGLATGAADYICGPVAAQAFLHSQGRNPTLQEALDLARGQGLIDPTNGMHGIDSTVQLIRKLGGTAHVGEVDTNRIYSELQAGRPVILNTPLHYFVIEGYDPQTGRFDLGNSAKTLHSSGGNQWYTLGELANLTIGNARVGTPRGAIYAGN